MTGGIDQLGEHRLCKPRVVGASPATSTCHSMDPGGLVGFED